MAGESNCPFCGANLQMSKGHSCQDSENDEYYHMQADQGRDPMAARKSDAEWEKQGFGGGKNFEPGTIIKKG